MQYRMWLANKLNDIKRKYREMATACLLRTRLAFVGEVQNYYQAAKTALGDIPLSDEQINANAIAMADELQDERQQLQDDEEQDDELQLDDELNNELNDELVN